MRLIDADELKAAHGMKDDCADCDKELRGKSRSCEFDRIYSLMDFCGWVDDASTIEPERQTAQWIYGEDNSGTGRDGWFCSKCKHFEMWDYSADMKSAEINLSNFCPNCGAAMTEGLWCKNDKRMIKEKPDSDIECLWNEVK